MEFDIEYILLVLVNVIVLFLGCRFKVLDVVYVNNSNIRGERVKY